MINFRYHVVSLTAVFLALVIGIAMGTTVVSKATVDGLRSNLHRAEARSSAVNSRNNQLSSDLSTLRKQSNEVDADLTDKVLAPALGDTLKDVPVLVIASKGVETDVLNRSIRALVASGAQVDGTLLVDDRLDLTGENAARMAAVLQVDPDSDVRRTLLSRLATVLATAASMPGVVASTTTTTTVAPTTSLAPGTTQPDATGAPATTTTLPRPAPEQPELITVLRAAGFLEFRPLEGKSADGKVLLGSDYRYAVISDADPDVPNASFLAPLIVDLAQLGEVPLVAASAPTKSDDSDRDVFVSSLLARDPVKGRISTVDDLDRFSGLVGLVFALREAGQGRHGQYGLGRTATAVVPAYAP
jgi:hypothetical protein